MKVTGGKRSDFTRNRTNGSSVKWFSTLVITAGLGCFAVCVVGADPAGTPDYPDLVSLPPSDIGIQYDPGTGRKLLRFSNSIANISPLRPRRSV